MTLVQVAKGRYYSKSDGTKQTYLFDVYDWGFSVKDLQVGAVVYGRSSVDARFSVRILGGFSDDTNAWPTAGITAINNAVVDNGAPLPRTFSGPVTNYGNPYFRVALDVDAATGSAEQYVELELYAGGKAY